MANKLPFDYRQTAGFYFSSHTTSAGDITMTEDIVIDGQFSGQITTTSLCEIAENANAHCDIQARAITIYGFFEGNCNAKDTIVVKKSAKIKGYLVAPTISVEAGAILDARCKQPRAQSVIRQETHE